MRDSRKAPSARIRVGIGGWSYEPWRQTFYPPDVTKKAELHYASRKLTAIEINSTVYRLQTPSVFARWRDETPDDFIFSLKAPRFVTNRRVLDEAGDAIGKFLSSGIEALGVKLGPLLWQLPPSKAFNAVDIESFFKLLPGQLGKLELRHAFEVRHESFKSEAYLALARKHEVTTVFADSDTHPSFADVTGDFIYARLMKTISSEATGYPKNALAQWSKRLQTWHEGGDPADLPHITRPTGNSKARDIFVFFISGAKERAPAAALHTLSILR
jgi:uncharacterized protein YecE (DUF72 family)